VVSSMPDIHRQSEVTEDGTHHAAAQSQDQCQGTERWDSIFETVVLMEEEEVAAQLAADSSAADKGAAAGSHVDLHDMEDSDITEKVEQ
jgi:hypothetical protein